MILAVRQHARAKRSRPRLVDEEARIAAARVPARRRLGNLSLDRAPRRRASRDESTRSRPSPSRTRATRAQAARRLSPRRSRRHASRASSRASFPRRFPRGFSPVRTPVRRAPVPRAASFPPPSARSSIASARRIAARIADGFTGRTTCVMVRRSARHPPPSPRDLRRDRAARADAARWTRTRGESESRSDPPMPKIPPEAVGTRRLPETRRARSNAPRARIRAGSIRRSSPRVQPRRRRRGGASSYRRRR